MKNAAPHFLKFYPGKLPWQFSPTKKPVYALFEESAIRHPHRICIDFLGRTYTYVEIQGLINRFAAGLQSLGVKKGHRVGLCLPNSPYFVIAYFAALRVGATVVNFNPLYTDEEIAAQTRDSGTTVMIAVGLSKITQKLKPLVSQRALRHLVICPLEDILPLTQSLLFRIFKFSEISRIPTHPAWHTFNELVVCGTHPQPVEINPDEDIALIQYTGGTTGIPKGACLTHANLISNAEQIKLWLGKVSSNGERFLGILPLFHVFALSAGLHLAMSTASTLIMLPSLNMPQLLATIRRTCPTVFPGVPTLFNALAQTRKIHKYGLSSIRYCISGGAPLPLQVRKAFETITGARLVEGYGLTEASPVVACNPRHLPSKEGSVGLPLPGTHIQIRHLHNKHKVLPAGHTGEVYIKGPQVMAGYWNNYAETAQVLQNGWLRTGDIGFIDADGYLHLTDRAKDIIITNGYNVYPGVIEAAAYRHPAVGEVTAIAIPDPHKGEVAKVFVALKPDTHVTEAELLTFIREHLNPIERPAALEIRPTLPKTPAGKLSKKELIAEERMKREKI